MKFTLYLLIITLFTPLYAQVLTDEYSAKRDTVFYKLKCNSSEISLKRILNKLERNESFSIRQGRELLVAVDLQGDTIYEFEEIGGYSSLFFESASFELVDVGDDGLYELIIEIYPHESAKYIWLYQLNNDCTFKFIGQKQADSFEINNDELIIKTSAICSNWDDCNDLGHVLGRVEYDRLYRLDFYKIQNYILVSSNSEHTREIKSRIEDYKMVLHQLGELELDTQNDWLKIEIAEVTKRLNRIIEEN